MSQQMIEAYKRSTYGFGINSASMRFLRIPAPSGGWQARRNSPERQTLGTLPLQVSVPWPEGVHTTCEVVAGLPARLHKKPDWVNGTTDPAGTFAWQTKVISPLEVMTARESFEIMKGNPVGLWRILQLVPDRRSALLDDPSATSWATATPPPIAVNVAVKAATLQTRRIMSSRVS
jgi:hypothetical protein